MTIKEQVNAYCAEIGADMDYVQGAGGNVSWKDGDTMWIKASGTWLADALSQEIFLPVDFSALSQSINQGDFEAKPLPLGKVESNLRPSIETILHAVMPHKVVVHTHLKEALLFLVQSDCESLLSEKLKDISGWGVVPYAKPGPKLGENVKALLDTRPCNIVFLSNHGVIIGGDSVDEVKSRYQQLKSVLKLDLSTHQISSSAVPENQIDIKGMVIEPKLTRLITSGQVLSILNEHWVMYPDHVVFLGAKAPVYVTLNELKETCEGGSVPDLAIIPGLGAYVSTELNKNKTAMLEFFIGFLEELPPDASISSLTSSDVGELLNWDAEKYRQAIAK